MSLDYKPHYCENCGREQGGKPTSFQYLIFILLLTCAIFPGVIYYFLATPSRCYISGLKKRHKNNGNEPKKHINKKTGQEYTPEEWKKERKN